MDTTSRVRAYFTPLVLKKLSLMTLLSVQIGFQPLLMGWYARESTNVKLRVGVIEGMKLTMSLLPLILTGEFGQVMKKWNVHTSLQTTAAPALIYVLQNYLNQTAVVLLDGVTFNILNQTKIIWTALLVYVMLRRYQSRQQIVALTVLCAAAVLMTTGKTKHKTDEDEKEDDAAFFTGAYQALIAAILSALAGTIIQRALQTQRRNAYMVTVELSIMAELTLLLWTLTTSNNGFFSKPASTDLSDVLASASPDAPERSMWHGWTFWTFFTLFCQAGGGVVVGFVIKHCGNVEKSFSVVIGMIITALLENRYNNKPFGIRGVISIAMVAVATIMYTMYPVQASPDALPTSYDKQSSPRQITMGVDRKCSNTPVDMQLLTPMRDGLDPTPSNLTSKTTEKRITARTTSAINVRTENDELV